MRKREQPVSAPNGPETAGELTPRQEAAALALASGKTLKEAARATKAGARTIRTWTATLPAFRARVAEHRTEMTSRCLGRLADSMASAADTLGYLSRKAKGEQTRLLAARACIELGVKLRETVELEARLAALESAQKGKAGR